MDAGSREDVYRSLAAFAQTEEAKHLHGERKRLVSSSCPCPDVQVTCCRQLERLLRDFRRNGVHLEKATRDAVKAVQQEMTKECIAFHKNLRTWWFLFALIASTLGIVSGEDNTTLKFATAQLAGGAAPSWSRCLNPLCFLLVLDA